MSRHQDAEARAQGSAGLDARERLLADLPVTQRRLPLAGVSTAVLAGGDGPPVILLHGPGEFAAAWLRVIPDLVTTHRVVAPDLPGHGATEMLNGRRDRMGGRLEQLEAYALDRARTLRMAAARHRERG